jgi:hypothetical protein
VDATRRRRGVPVYYKAVPKQFMNGIKVGGLDPAKAGQPGGATAMALASVVRQPTELDTNHTWLGSKSQARDYAESWFSNRSPIILKIDLPEHFAKHALDDHGTSGATTRTFIPPCYISFQIAKGDYWAKIATYNGNNAYIAEDDSSSEEEEWSD